jgi:DNA-binding CsgD family transcriptional regulator/tetratricopeptide (TPR) repeat protein
MSVVALSARGRNGAGANRPQVQEAAVAPARLVGRVVEQRATASAIETVAGGHPAGVAFVGEPGIGKTALLAAAGEQARLAGLSVIHARGVSTERDVPLGLVARAFDGIDDAGPVGLLGAREAAQARSEQGWGPGPKDSTWKLHYRTRHALRSALEGCAIERPVALVLDDVDRADELSIQLVAHVLAHGLRTPILVVLGYDPARAPRSLLDAVAMAGREQWFGAIEIDTLGREAAAELVSELTPQLRRAVYRESGGNPFYLTELTRAAIRSDWIPSAASGPDTVPSAISSAVSTEVDRLSVDARRLAEAAAVIGPRFDVSLAAQVGELGEEPALRAIDELTSSGLVRATETPWRFAFRHPVVCSAVYESADLSFRLMAHARAVAALELGGAPRGAWAYHVERSARPGDDRSVDVLVRAAQGAQRSDPEAAVRWLQAALRLLAPGADRGRRVELLVALATALGETGRPFESRRVLRAALPLVAADHTDTKARLVSGIMRLGHMVGQRGDARELCIETLNRIRSARSWPLQELRLQMAMDRWFAGEPSAVIEAARVVRGGVDLFGEAPVEAMVCAIEAHAAIDLGDIDGAQLLADRSARLVDGLPDCDLGDRVEALLALGFVELSLERFSESVCHLERGVALARNSAQQCWSCMLLLLLSAVRLAQGRVQEADKAAGAALENARHPYPRGWALSMRGWLRTLRGDHERAEADAEHAAQMLEDAEPTIFGDLARGWLAATFVDSGKPERARVATPPRSLGGHVSSGATALLAQRDLSLAACELARGHLETAEGWIARAESSPAPGALEGVAGEVRFWRAVLALARGDAALAQSAAIDAASSFAKARRSLDAARAELLAGQAAAALGAASALTILRRAYFKLDECGDVCHRDEAARAQRDLAERASPSSVASAHTQDDAPALQALTPREREVATLVVSGMSNRQIAEQLFVSPKTVESHVSHIFDKLAISSRVSLAYAIASKRTLPSSSDEERATSEPNA